MYRTVLYLVFALVFSISSTKNAEAQSYFELGGSVGLSNYSGDLTPSNIGPVVAQSHPALSAFARFNVNPRFSTRLGLTYAVISGSDALSGSDQLKRRNLSFDSDIYEIAGMLEVNIFKFSAIEGESIFTPYFAVGFGAFRFDPTTEYNGQRIRLQPLGTEGQGTSAAPNNPKYSLVQLNIPFGGGVKFKLSDNITGFVDLTWRWTFTDYLDDVSTIYADPEILLSESGELAVALSNRTGEFLGQEGYVSNGNVRGGPTVNDYYFMGAVGVSFAFNSRSGNISLNRRGNRRRNSRIDCPKF